MTTHAKNIIWVSLVVCPPLGVGMLVGYFSNIKSVDRKSSMRAKEMLQLGIVIFAFALALLAAGYLAGKSLASLEGRADSLPVFREGDSEQATSPDS